MNYEKNSYLMQTKIIIKKNNVMLELSAIYMHSVKHRQLKYFKLKYALVQIKI